MKILYKFHYNRIEIIGYEKHAKLNLTSSSGKAELSFANKSDEFNVEIGYYDENLFDTIKAYVNDHLELSEVFSVEKTSAWALQLGDIKSKEASRLDIFFDPVLKLLFPESNYGNCTFVLNFRMSVFGKSGDLLKTFENSDINRLTKEQIDFIGTLHAGDKLKFDHVIFNEGDNLGNFLSLDITIK